jgi:hypothetical protein
LSFQAPASYIVMHFLARCKQLHCRATKRGERDHATVPGPVPGIDRRFNRGRRHTMNLKQTTQALTFGAMLGIAALSMPALADHIDANFQTAVKQMANKDGMVSKKDFMEMAAKRFDMMDKGKKGMISETDVMHIFGRSDKP